MSESGPVLMLFRQDLRLDDNPALRAAADSGRPVICAFILDDEEGPWAWGGASRWWLHHSLAALDGQLHLLGGRLVYRRGPLKDVLPQLVTETGCGTVFWNTRLKPHASACDEETAALLGERGIRVRTHLAALMIEPDALATGQGKPYQVFTPYWKKFIATPRVPRPLDAPTRLNPVPQPDGPPLESLELLPTIPWDGGLQEMWNPGAEAAKVLLQRFLKDPLEHYDEGRDRPAVDGTSRLSPHLHWGEISPRRLWHVCHGRPGAEPWLRQLVWREFAYQMLHHFPHTPDHPLREEFAAFPWDGDPAWLSAWQKGETGYPLVDAGMRQLWHTGWMHNRVRMVVASFLIKHLLRPWQEGARWFWDTLVDADLANNTFGWQWTAGCGADASPYFRIFNPISQGRKFQAEEYIRQWVPQLRRVPDKLLHEPWTGSQAALGQAGIRLGRDYPRPIVDHKEARQRALDSYRQMKAGS